MSLFYVTLFLRVFIFKSKMVVRRNRKTHNRLPQKKQRQWNVREKLMIVHYFENNGSVRGTAKRFNIQPKQLRDWKNKKQNLYIQNITII